MEPCDLSLLVRLIDEATVDVGVSKLVDGDKVRDLFLDLRIIVSSMMNPIQELPEAEILG